MASMVVKVKASILIFLMIFTCPNSGGALGLSQKEGLKEDLNPCGQKIMKGKMMRKVLEMEAILMDYNEPGANPRHEPRKGSPRGRPTISRP